MCDYRKVSYLRARDPSVIISSNLMARVLEDCFEEEEEDEDLKVKNAVKAYLRIKRTKMDENLYQINGDSLHCYVPVDSQAGKHVKSDEQRTRVYQFTEIFPPESTQIEIFNNVIKSKVFNFINGENSNILTYGASGSGKTFTIVGTKDEPGMIPQSLEYLFRSLPKLSKFPIAKPQQGNHKVTWLNSNEMREEIAQLNELLNNSLIEDESEQHAKVYKEMQKRLSQEPVASVDCDDAVISIWISFAEIYNEQVFDLLEVGHTPKKKLKIINNKGETYIKDLKHVYVASATDAYLVLQYGLKNLKYAATNINDHSSRSHCLFTISLLQTKDHDSSTFLVSRLTFCDLAGSERSKKTKNIGSRLNESNCINTSLLVLGRCINIIRDNQQRITKTLIPYRESKLTQLFQSALQGHDSISMIVNISADPAMVDETIHTLNFSSVARDIVLNKCSTIDDSNVSSSVIHDLKTEITTLQEKVNQLNYELQLQKLTEEEREREVRMSMIQNFEEVLKNSKAASRKEMQIRLMGRDEQINELRAEIERLKHDESSDASVICLLSDDEDAGILDLSRGTINSSSRLLKRYEELYQKHDDFKTKMNLKMKEHEEIIKNLQQKLKRQERINKELHRAKDDAKGQELIRKDMEILKLNEELSFIKDEMDCSLRYSRRLVQAIDNESNASSDNEIS